MFKILVFNVFCIVLMMFGLYINQSETSRQEFEAANQYKWIKNLFDTEHKGEQAVAFVVNILSLVGTFYLILYTGYGLGTLPFYLIKGKKSLWTISQEFEMGKAQVRERIRSLQEKKGVKGNLSKREQKELNKLRADEQDIDRRMVQISNFLESEKLLNRFIATLTPFRVIIGIALLAISGLIFVSLFVTSLDRLLHSKCGVSCGFLLDDMNYSNYLDQALLNLSNYFHLDYLLFTIINLYVYICSVFGFVKLGIKIFLFTVNSLIFLIFRCLIFINQVLILKAF